MWNLCLVINVSILSLPLKQCSHPAPREMLMYATHCSNPTHKPHSPDIDLWLIENVVILMIDWSSKLHWISVLGERSMSVKLKECDKPVGRNLKGGNS
jgi:hypothetical protein